jgi:hypothetical protein
MYDVDAIEAINFEQLATVTDRLLLRARGPRRRLTRTGATPSLARGSQPRLTLDPYETTLVDTSRRIVMEEKTVRVVPSTTKTQRLALTYLIPGLLGIAIGLATML